MPDVFFFNKQINRNLKHPLSDGTLSLQWKPHWVLVQEKGRLKKKNNLHTPTAEARFMSISPPPLITFPATPVIQTLGRYGGTERCHSCLFPPQHLWGAMDWGLWTGLVECSWWDTPLTQLLKPLMGVHQSTSLCRYFHLSTCGRRRDCSNYLWLGLPKLCRCSGNFIPNPFSSMLRSFGN